VKVQTPVIGIPKWPWKKKLLNIAKQCKPSIVDITDFCFECTRHLELLQAIDDGKTDFSGTEYYKYQVKKYDDASINKKIKHFNKIYKSIKKHGCREAPVVTDDGCRLDGSHRLSILIHLGVTETPVKIVRYEDIYSKQKSNLIRQEVNEYRKNIYGF
jgi:hypothetical protein